MNTLKTDVKQFIGYNEKNSTVFGGTLSPIYDKKTELFDKDNSYTFLNSKGVPYTLVKGDASVELYEGTTRVGFGYHVTNVEQLDVPEDALAAAKMINGDVVFTRYEGSGTFYVYINNRIFYYISVEHTSSSIDRLIVPFSRIWKDPDNDDAFFVGYISRETLVNSTGTVDSYFYRAFIVHLKKSQPTYHPHTTSISMISSINWNLNPILTGGKSGDTMKFAFMANSGSFNTTGYWVRTTTFDYSTGSFNDWDDTLQRTFFVENPTYLTIDAKDVSDENDANQFAVRAVTKLTDTKYTTNYPELNSAGSVPTVNGKIECPYTNLYSYDTGRLRFVYKDDSLICIGNLNLPIEPFFSFKKSYVYWEKSDPNDIWNSDGNITYQKNDGKWYNYNSRKIRQDDTLSVEDFKSFVYMNRYVCLGEHGSYLYFYDIEKQISIKNLDLSWVDCWPPLFIINSTDTTEKGVVYCAGVNAGYMVSNAELVGYLPNPYVGTFVGGDLKWNLGRFRGQSTVQSYYTVGNTAQSAKYQGEDPQYYDTLYPIDPNGNIVLPVSQNAQIIKGYSNNDMVKEGDTVYPLMYWNNNQKTYSYFLLAGIENITNVFSLQGQQYTVNDENIYAVAFNGGVVSQVQSVSYKKNLTFLGTLPTQAVFWSDYNKTFYAFTGDRILSKMFEASDIHKILYVGQNPSSLSLWVCTDTGIYILSDTDQFKLDYISKMVEFQPKNTVLLTEGEENNEVHAVSLYLDEGEEGEMIPVKLETSYYGLGNEMKAVMDCWYLRLFDENNTKGYVKAKVHTITDVTRHTEEKTFEVNPSDYDENHIVYLRFQPKYQECVSMQLELETNLGIYQISLGVNTTDSTAQVSKFNF